MGIAVLYWRKYSAHQNLRTILSSEKSLTWQKVCLVLVRAICAFHTKGVLHNVLHSGNILVKYNQYVKIINLGKSAMIDDPIVYFIKPETGKSKRYEN